mmetsp:Transcript_21880/g.33013  ORF Transcript_21880/g.33013 Transcript_21880/m.33013 type:complete len:156 (+) Transcript_21880:21-488(+)
MKPGFVSVTAFVLIAGHFQAACFLFLTASLFLRMNFDDTSIQTEDDDEDVHLLGVQEMRVAEGQPLRRKDRKVSFDDSLEVLRIEHHWSFSEMEKESCWWSRDDLKGFTRKVRRKALRSIAQRGKYSQLEFKTNHSYAAYRVRSSRHQEGSKLQG